MNITTLPLGLIRTNCYLVSTEKAALVIDPGFESKQTEDFLEQNKDKECMILLTHCHFDHIGGAKTLGSKFNVKIAIGKDDNEGLSNGDISMSNRFHAKVAPFSADIKFEGDEVFKIGDITVKVINTSGHTVGGVSYLVEEALFSGDTLFKESIGRTDFVGGDLKTLINSVKRLFTLPDNTAVYTGHGEMTYIGYEKEHNMFVR